MRYGENPHQKAAFYVEKEVREASIATARQLQGKELSYNNIGDTDAALECVKQFSEGPACVIVKHANPCGVAVGDDLLEAYDRAYKTDPESAFGGIIAVNRELDAATAQAICERQFVEVIIAPKVSAGAPAPSSPPRRTCACSNAGSGRHSPRQRLDFKRVNGGLLVQETDLDLYDELKVVTKRQPTDQEMEDLLFTWRVAKFVKSNAIVYGKDEHDHRRRRRADEPGQLGAHRRHQGRARRARRQGRGHGLRRLLPLPRRHRQRRRRRHHRRHPARRLACATPRSSPPPTSTAWRWSLPACGISGIELCLIGLMFFGKGSKFYAEPSARIMKWI